MPLPSPAYIGTFLPRDTRPQWWNERDWRGAGPSGAPEASKCCQKQEYERSGNTFEWEVGPEGALKLPTVAIIGIFGACGN
jgi:hypothetical protein